MDKFSQISLSFINQMKALKSSYSNYPFGMQMPGRSNSYGAGVEYRYAYNGMELDNEVSGNGNTYTTEFRQYDPRLGRWKSLDPLMAQFPFMSPYVAFDNNPIFYIDPLGLASEDWNEKEATTKADRMKDKGYENVKVVQSVDKDGNKTDNYGVSTTGLQNGSGSGHYFDKSKSSESKEMPKFVEKPDAVDKHILAVGLESFKPSRPYTAPNTDQWQKNLADWNYKNMSTNWDNMSEEAKWQSTRQNIILGGLSSASQEMMAPAGNMYTILAAAGGSGMVSGVRIGSAAVAAEREFIILNPTAPATNMMRKTVMGSEEVIINTGHAYNRVHATGGFELTGLTTNQIENAIINDLSAFTKAGGIIPSTSNMAIRSVTLDGVEIGYNVGKANGAIRITNYYPK